MRNMHSAARGRGSMVLALMRSNATHFPAQVRNGELVYGELGCARVEDLPSCLINHCRFEVVQLDQGESCCDLDFVAGSRAALCRQRLARSLNLCGTMSVNWLALGLVRGGMEGEKAGGRARDDLLHLVRPGETFDWFLQAGQTLLLVMAGQDALLELAGEAHAGTGVRELIRGGSTSKVLRGDTSAVTEGWDSLVDLLEDARRGELAGSDAAFGFAVLEQMVFLLDAAGDDVTSDRSAEVVVRRARSLVGEVPRRFSISRMSGELRVSPRTLHKAFAEVTGLGPHAYFLRQRLNAARHLLTHAEPGRASVTNVALELGFTELGRFAGRYRDFFGESPSQTLQRPRRLIDAVPG